MQAARGRGLLGGDRTATRRVQSPSRTRGSHSGGHEAGGKQRQGCQKEARDVRSGDPRPGDRPGAGARRARPVVRATGGRGAGLAGDGRFVALARFESEEAARRNSDRPEQDQWWMETSKLFVGEVIFRDSSDVTVDVNGDPDKAGFVQVMQGRSSDPDRARELMAQNPDEWAAFRPDVIGSVTVGHEGGAYTMAMYFTSEQ